MNFLGNMADRFFGMFGYFRADAQTRANTYSTRVASFAANEMMYDNTIYQYGMRSVLCECFGWESRDLQTRAMPLIVGHFNPAKEIVDSYLNVLPGTYGHEMRAVAPDPTKTLDRSLADAIARLWRDSNLDTAKQSMQQWCANLGTVGMRPVSIPDANGETTQIRIQIDHPSRLFTVEEDSQGNVTSAVLKYKKPHNFGTPLQPDIQQIEVIEQINKDEFSMTFNDEQQVEDTQRPNTFGFCPYVILRHKDNGTLFGDWAYKGAERPIHAINYRMSRQDSSLDRHMFPNWFAVASGQPPKTMPLDDEKMSYVQQPAGAPTPILEPLVPKIDHGSAMKFWMECRDMLRGRQPELTINDVRLLAGISGETLAQVLKPAEAAILAVRPAYDHAMIRVLQMAVSIGSDLGLWNIGTGNGDGAGDKAYRAGKEAFAFADRPALPQTVYDKIKQAEADTARRSKNLVDANLAANVVDPEEQLHIAGYTPDETKAILDRKRTAGTIPTTPL